MCSPKVCAPAVTQVCDRNVGQQINEKASTGNSESFGYREEASQLLTDELKLYFGQFWTDFRMSLGHFEALLQMLILI